ncbi:MAG: cytochrome c3 family protein [Pseudomonadota bacterium]
MNFNIIAWTSWIMASVAGVVYLSYVMTAPDVDRTVFVPGPMTDGHHQIELACESCHGTEGFTDAEVLQNACIGCHGDALEEAKDDHPKSKFTDPRNADRLAVLDARYCVTCHVEHRPERTHAMGLTLPLDYCILCHEDVALDRPSHEGMAFDTCASAGCHNFHDNRALYEDFLVRHMDQPWLLSSRVTLLANFEAVASQIPGYPVDHYPMVQLAADNADTPADPGVLHEWAASSHAAAGVNCKACHQTDQGWQDSPSREMCGACHSEESRSFLLGKHGMRLAEENLLRELTPMAPGLARLPMKSDAHSKELGCISCHGAHEFDSRSASVDACMNCHDDDHSLAYEASPHAALVRAESLGQLPPGSGVTCATCHMPRIEKDYFWTFEHNLVQHNQSETMRPNEKMIRPVCQNCHGLSFSIDALADVELIKRNFKGQPNASIASVSMARERDER